MRRYAFTRLLAALAIGLSLLLPAAPAAAKNSVTVEGTTVVIHVPIDVLFREPFILPAKRTLTLPKTGEKIEILQYLKREVELIWNEAFKGFVHDDCLSFRLDLQFFPITSEKQRQPGHHFVQLGDAAPGMSWDMTGPDDKDPTRDTPFPYSRDYVGQWDMWDPSVIAHEIGHALGLGDDYFTTCDANGYHCKTTGKKPSGELIEGADIPAERPAQRYIDAARKAGRSAESFQGGTFTTGGTGIPDPAAVIRVIKQMKAAGVLPQCWKGTVKLERDGVNPGCSAIKSEGEFSLAVAGDATVSGWGVVDHSSYTCPPITFPATHATIKLGGKKQDGTFMIGLLDWDPKNAAVPRLPFGQWTVHVGQGANGEGTHNMKTWGASGDIIFRIKLQCVTCSRP